MAVRFAPFAKIKVASLASYIYKTKDGQPRELQAAVTDFTAAIQKFTANPDSTVLDEAFEDVALATSVSISENYNTRATFGIGAPTNPFIIPGALSVQVTIARLTTDSRQIADYVTKPSFYYSAALQKISATNFASAGGTAGDLDLLFYTYIFIDSLEPVKFAKDGEKLQNAELIAFMPTTYNKRIESNDAAIVTDVSGEGKIFKLRDLINGLSSLTPVDTLLKKDLPTIG